MTFSDVEAKHKNSEAIYNMAENGIVNGYDDGSFKPDNHVTRAELCTFIARVFGYNKNIKLKQKLPFSDVPDAYWAIDYIKYAYSKGIINGMGDGTFLPAGNVTYEQAVKMIVCTAGLEDEAEMYSGEKWYSGYLEAANNNGILENVLVDIGMSATRADIVQLIYDAVSNDLIDITTEFETDDKIKDTSDYDINDEEKSDNANKSENKEESVDESVTETTEIKEIKTIVIDPGHNYEGYDKGARTEDGSVIEEIITWQISKKVVKYLEEYGFDVYLTREGEKSSIASNSVTESLKARVDIANELEADLFISIHCNTGGGTGVETYCFDLNGSSAPVAKAISKAISKEADLYNRGAKEANFYVIKNTVMPAVLIETGFIDNKKDVAVLKSDSGQGKIAKAIAEAVFSCKTIEVKKKTVLSENEENTEITSVDSEISDKNDTDKNEEESENDR